MKLLKFFTLTLALAAGGNTCYSSQEEPGRACNASASSCSIKPASSLKSLIKTFGPYAGVLIFYMYVVPVIKAKCPEKSEEGIKKILELFLLTSLSDKVKGDGKTLYAFVEYFYDSALNVL